VAVLLILLGGGALRLWTAGLGTHSLTLQPDEDSNVPPALSLSWTSFNPHAFCYPALFYRLD
jgi:hypothetical protein